MKKPSATRQVQSLMALCTNLAPLRSAIGMMEQQENGRKKYCDSNKL